MILLSIETATPVGSVALLRGEELLGERVVSENLRHSEGLIEAVRDLLEAAGLSPRDLEAVAVSAGPGSFTGIRVGMALGKGVAFSLSIPLQPVETLAVLAGDAVPFPGLLFPVIGAEGPEVYGALFAWEGSWRRRGEDRVFDTGELPDFLREKTRIFGPGISKHGDAIRRLSSGVWSIDEEPVYPRAFTVGKIAGKALGEGNIPLAEVRPHYVKPTQLMWKRKDMGNGQGNEASIG